MPEINATYDLDLSKVAGAFARVEEMGKKASASVNGGSGAFRGQIAGSQKAAQSFGALKQSSDAARSSISATGSAGQRAFRLLSSAGKAGEAIFGLANGYKTLRSVVTALSQRGAVLARITQAKAAAARLAAGATQLLNSRLGKTVAVAGVVAAGIWAIRRAWTALAGAKKPDLDLKTPGAGGIGGGMGMGMKAGIAGAAIGAVALGAMVFGAVKDGMTRAITQAAEMEQIEIGFEVLTGGPQQAKQLLGEIKTLAANTPMSFGDLATAGRQLAAFKEPLEGLPDTLRRIGDISSGIGAPVKEIAELYGKARVQGTLFAEDINQLTGRGIDVISEFAGQLGVTTSEVKKLASEGKIGFDMLEKAFISMTGEGGTFADMMERQSKTVAGLWSTLTDNVTMAFTAMGAPINDAIRPLLAKAIEMTETFGAHFEAVGQRIAGIINFIHAAFNTMSGGEMFSALGDYLKLAFMQAIDVLARGVQAIFASAKDAGFMDAIGEKIRGMGVILKDVLLSAVQAVMAEMGKIKGLEFLKASASGIGVTRMEDKFTEQLRKKQKSDQPEVDLAGEFKKNFEGAEGLFGPAINDLESGLKKKMRPVFEEAARLLAEQKAEGEASGSGSGSGSGAGDVITAASGGPMAGAFQQAKNLISGKTVNEMVAQEAQKTNEKLDGLKVAINENTKAVKDNGYKPTKGGTKVEVVPVF